MAEAVPLALAVALTIGIVSACVAKPAAVQSDLTLDGGAPVRTVYVASHGWHTGIILPGREIRAALPALGERFGDVPYYEFGWGDEGFYRARKVTCGLALKAVFLPTPSVLHVVAVTSDPKDYFRGSEVVALNIGKRGFERLTAFVMGSFARDRDGNIQLLGEGIYGESRFYRGEGTYFLTNTCNTWTAKGLSRAGIEILPAFKLTAESVMRRVRRAGARSSTPQARSSPIIVPPPAD